MKFVPLIFRNLLRNRRRTILSVMSIAVSTVIFAGLMSVPAVAARLLHDRISTLRLICGNKAGFNYLLPAAYGETIRDLPHVSAMTGYLAMMTNYRKPGELIPVIGVDPDQLHIIWPEWASAQAAAALGRSRSAGLGGRALMKRFKWKVGNNVILHGLAPPADLSFTIAGTLDSPTVDNFVIVPIERLNKLEDFQGRVTIFFVKADASEFAQPLLKQIDARFANAPFETSTQTELGVAQSQLHDFRLLFDGAQLFAAIVVIVIALVSTNTAAMAVRERRHELAVMRALGFTRRSLVGFIVTEGLLMGLAAGALGSAIAYGLLRIFGPALLGPEFGLRLMPAVAAESIAAAAVIGLVSAAIPGMSDHAPPHRRFTALDVERRSARPSYFPKRLVARASLPVDDARASSSRDHPSARIQSIKLSPGFPLPTKPSRNAAAAFRSVWTLGAGVSPCRQPRRRD